MRMILEDSETLFATTYEPQYLIKRSPAIPSGPDKGMRFYSCLYMGYGEKPRIKIAHRFFLGFVGQLEQSLETSITIWRRAGTELVRVCMDDDEESYACNTCLQILPLPSFGYSGPNRTGRLRRCKACTREVRRQSRIEKNHGAPA